MFVISLRRLCHPKLVQLYGVCLQQRPLLIVAEFMENGCLLNFLRQRGGTLREAWLLSMSQDVCEGMEYLESKKFVHRDLAARNVLISDDSVAKVSDFGLTKVDSKVSDNAKLPIKWTAPEALKKEVGWKSCCGICFLFYVYICLCLTVISSYRVFHDD